MNVMVTGSRDWRDIEVIRRALISAQGDRPPDAMMLLQGCASGADTIARSISISLGWLTPMDFWPDYALYDFAEANKLRNQKMVDFKPDLVLAFPTRRSRGTWDAVNKAKKAGYVKGETLLIYSEREDFRRTKSLEEYPEDPYLWESGT